MHLFLRPQPDDFAWVEFAEAVDEAIVVLDVAVSILEVIECGFENLQNHLVGNRLLLQTRTHTHTQHNVSHR